jgi:hypothetical protein
MDGGFELKKQDGGTNKHSAMKLVEMLYFEISRDSIE